MGRIRSIKPDFPQSESMGRVSRDARLLFLQLFTLVDDAGRTRAASRLLASLLYPFDQDAHDLIDEWMNELNHEECILLYEAEGNRYLQITNWLKHQKIEKPSKSKIPPFGESSPNVRRILPDSSHRVPERGAEPPQQDKKASTRETGFNHIERQAVIPTPFYNSLIDINGVNQNLSEFPPFGESSPKPPRSLPNPSATDMDMDMDLRFLDLDTLSGDDQKTDDLEKTGEDCADALGTLKHARRVSFADIEKVLTHLNERTGHSFAGKRPNGSETANAGYIRQLLKSGYDVAACIAVIDLKHREWANDSERVKYLRPSTLFRRTNFDTYVGALKAPKTASTARRDHQAPEPTKRTQPPIGALRGALKPGFKAHSSPVLARSDDEQE